MDLNDPPKAESDGADYAESVDMEESDYADPADMFVPRDEDDNIAEVERDVAGYGTCVFQPMTYGQVEKYLGDAGSVSTAGPDAVAGMLREGLVEPDLERYARESFREKVDPLMRRRDGPDHYMCGHVVREEMNPFAPQALLMALMRVSGMNVNVTMNQEGEATIEFGDDDEGN